MLLGIDPDSKGEMCTVDYGDILFVADSHRFEECIVTNNGSPVPELVVPNATEHAEGQYVARFEASWAYLFDPESCVGQLTGLKITCTNGAIELLESSVEDSCEVTSTSEIECTETRTSAVLDDYLASAAYVSIPFS